MFFLMGSLAVTSGLTSTFAPLSSWIMFSVRYDIPRIDEKIMYHFNNSYDTLRMQCRPEGEEQSLERAIDDMTQVSKRK